MRIAVAMVCGMVLSGCASSGGGQAAGQTGDAGAPSAVSLRAAQFAPDPGIFRAGAKMSFISNSYMGEWSGVHAYIREIVRATTPDHVPEMIPARETDGGWFWGMGLGSMTAALDRVEREGDYDTCVFLAGPLQVMRTFATRLSAACTHVVLFVSGGGRNPHTLREKLRPSVASALADARALEREFPKLLVVPALLVFYELETKPPVSVPRVDYLYGFDNIHQNGLGTLIHAYTMYTVMSGRSPVGVGFDYHAPAREDQRFIRGDVIGLARPQPFATPGDELLFSPDVRNLFLTRIVELVKQWQAGQTEFDSQ